MLEGVEVHESKTQKDQVVVRTSFLCLFGLSDLNYNFGVQRATTLKPFRNQQQTFTPHA